MNGESVITLKHWKRWAEKGYTMLPFVLEADCRGKAAVCPRLGRMPGNRRLRIPLSSRAARMDVTPIWGWNLHRYCGEGRRSERNLPSGRQHGMFGSISA